MSSLPIRLGTGFCIGLFSTLWIREVLEGRYALDGLSGAMWALSVGFVAILMLSLGRKWPILQTIAVFGVAVVGAILGIAIAIYIAST